MHLRRLPLPSVVKVSAAFYAVCAVLFTLFVVVLYLVGADLGAVSALDRLAVRVFNAGPHFHIGAGLFVAGGAALAVGVGLAGVAVNVVAAVIYNRIGDLTGGVGVTLAPMTGVGAGDRSGLQPGGPARPPRPERSAPQPRPERSAPQPRTTQSAGTTQSARTTRSA